MLKTFQVQKTNEHLDVLKAEKSDAENLLKLANEINQSRRNLEQNIKFLDDNENLHDLGIVFGISGFVFEKVQTVRTVRTRPFCDQAQPNR